MNNPRGLDARIEEAIEEAENLNQAILDVALVVADELGYAWADEDIPDLSHAIDSFITAIENRTDSKHGDY